MTAASFISSCPRAAGPPTAVAGKQFSITDWSNNSEKNSSYAAYAQATYSIWSDTRFTAGVRYTYDERYAHVATQSIRTPATAATTAALTNAVFNPTPFVYNGISYAGQSNVCLLTNPNGVTLPLVAMRGGYQQELPQADLDPGAGSRSVGGHHGLCDHALGLSLRRHQHPGAEYRRHDRAAGKRAGL